MSFLKKTDLHESKKFSIMFYSLVTNDENCCKVTYMINFIVNV